MIKLLMYFFGKDAFGIFVINNEGVPVIEHMNLKKESVEAERIEQEIRERFARANGL